MKLYKYYSTNLINKIIIIKLKKIKNNIQYYSLKKLILIIYKFHFNNGKLLLFGVSLKLFNILRKFKIKTKHVLIKYQINNFLYQYFNYKYKLKFNLIISFNLIQNNIFKINILLINIGKIYNLKFSIPIYNQIYFYYLLTYIFKKVTKSE